MALATFLNTQYCSLVPGCGSPSVLPTPSPMPSPSPSPQPHVVWPQRGCDTRHTGVTPLSGPLNGSNWQNIWTYTTPYPVVSSPAVGPDGTVYFGSNDDNVYALNGATGAVVSGAVDNARRISYVVGIFSCDCVCRLVLVKIWIFPTKDDAQSSPAVVDGRVFFGSDDNNFYCVNGTTGAKLWSYTYVPLELVNRRCIAMRMALLR